MPDPQAQPNAALTHRVARNTLLAGLVITGLKLGVFALTNSAAVLSDALESIINLVAAGAMLFSVWLTNRPADRNHPYGHGKVEFLTVGLEGWLILAAGGVIGYEGVYRLAVKNDLRVDDLGRGMWALAGVALLAAGLAAYVWGAGRRYQSAVLVADGKHLATDVISTLGGIAGLALARWTGHVWWDPAVALVMAAAIVFTSWRLLWESIGGLMDRSDPADEAVICSILDEELRAGTIRGYHKVRHRHNGSFLWIDMHLQVDPNLTIRDGHALATRIERRIEAKLGPGDATAHLEPAEEG